MHVGNNSKFILTKKDKSWIVQCVMIILELKRGQKVQCKLRAFNRLMSLQLKKMVILTYPVSNPHPISKLSLFYPTDICTSPISPIPIKFQSSPTIRILFPVYYAKFMLINSKIPHLRYISVFPSSLICMLPQIIPN